MNNQARRARPLASAFLEGMKPAASRQISAAVGFFFLEVRSRAAVGFRCNARRLICQISAAAGGWLTSSSLKQRSRAAADEAAADAFIYRRRVIFLFPLFAICRRWRRVVAFAFALAFLNHSGGRLRRYTARALAFGFGFGRCLCVGLPDSGSRRRWLCAIRRGRCLRDAARRLPS